MNLSVQIDHELLFHFMFCLLMLEFKLKTSWFWLLYNFGMEMLSAIKIANNLVVYFRYRGKMNTHKLILIYICRELFNHFYVN